MLKPLGDVEGSSAIGGYTMKKPMALEPWLYLAAIGLFVDRYPRHAGVERRVRLRRRAAATRRHLARAGAPAAASHRAAAQDAPVTAPAAAAAPSPASPADFALKASLQTHLAYVITGDPEIDRTSEEGLSGLSKVLRARTALEPADPDGRRYR